MKIHRSNSKRQGGFVLSSELMFILAILVIGSVTGLVTMRDALNAEMEDVAEAIGALDQSYAFNGIVNAQETAGIDGSSWGDGVDTNAGDNAEFSFVDLDDTEGSSVTTAPASSSADNRGNVPFTNLAN